VALLGLTVAVRVIVAPAIEGLGGDALSVVVVSVLPLKATIWPRHGELLLTVILVVFGGVPSLSLRSRDCVKVLKSAGPSLWAGVVGVWTTKLFVGVVKFVVDPPVAVRAAIRRSSGAPEVGVTVPEFADVPLPVLLAVPSSGSPEVRMPLYS
jgi:hypothetical protein